MFAIRKIYEPRHKNNNNNEHRIPSHKWKVDLQFEEKIGFLAILKITLTCPNDKEWDNISYPKMSIYLTFIE